MAIQKKPATNILTACFALGIIFLLWQTFGTMESTSHTGRYHPTSLLLTKGQLQTRQIKPQTLPKRKVAHPYLREAHQSLPREAAPSPPSSNNEISESGISEPVMAPREEAPQATTPDQASQAALPRAEQGEVAVEERSLPVTCSQDMSQPCLLSQGNT